MPGTVTTTTIPPLEPPSAMRPFNPPPVRPTPDEGGWRWLHGAVGLETFGRPAGPWGALFAPVPLGALALLGAKWLAVPHGTYPWLADRAGEALWLLIMPFVLTTLAHGAAQVVSEIVWRLSEGRTHLDWSPRRWHYGVGFAAAVLPLLALQVSSWLLDAYLGVVLATQSVLGPMSAVHVGYDPRLTNLFVVAVFPLVAWQATRIVAAVPPGRLLGLQRELARLRGAVAWGPDAWGEMVAEALDRWTADLAPREGEIPQAGEARRKHRQRWAALKKEIVAAWQGVPPDLARANRALHLYRSTRG